MSKRKKRRYGHFVRLSNKTLLSKEWKGLSPSAKILYTHLKSKYNGRNNGDIELHYSELKDVKGLTSSSTVSRTFKELINMGWVIKTKNGGLYRYTNSYELTWNYDDMD